MKIRRSIVRIDGPEGPIESVLREPAFDRIRIDPESGLEKMITIYPVETDAFHQQIRELFLEYLEYANRMEIREFGAGFDFESIVDRNMEEMEIFLPPFGRLLLARSDQTIAGVACLRKIEEHVGEIKRLYVRPDFRGQGIGRALLESLVEEARGIGYKRIVLDAAPYARTAETLYRSVGFVDTIPYPESEAPQELRSKWLFMKLEMG